jgi:tetratricopeptide (TPR) repeat protein
MGVLYEEIDRYGRAEQYYLRAIELDQRYLPPYVNLAYLYQRLGKTDQAAKYFKLRYEMGHPMDPWAQRAKDELVRMDPRYGAWAAAIEADSLNRELEVKSHREFVQRVEQSQEHYKKGDGFLKDERYREAIEEYDMALRLSPDNPKIINARKKALLETIKRDVREHSRQALMLLDAGDTLSARFEIQQMLKMIPKEPILIQP